MSLPLNDPPEPRIQLREPRSNPERTHWEACAGREGYIRSAGGQDCVRCCVCDRFLYNAPRVETGKEQRSVTTVHNGIKPKRRARILMRANGACELCHASGIVLHVGHMLSVKEGLEQNATEELLNSDENLAAMCEECNLGVGQQPIPLRLAIAIVMARAKNKGAASE